MRMFKHRVVYFNYVQFILCQLSLKITDIKNEGYMDNSYHMKKRVEVEISSNWIQYYKSQERLVQHMQ